jgi:signal transduction histidine kinase/pSer/pThr/pTyr-binding forkhead associated (FHA) protein
LKACWTPRDGGQLDLSSIGARQSQRQLGREAQPVETSAPGTALASRSGALGHSPRSFLIVPSLFVIKGRDQGTRFQLDDSTVTIGRGTTNAVQLHDTEVSREHVELSRRDDAFYVRDLGSSNGTFVNGRPVKEQELASGDQLQLGRTLLLFTGVTEGRIEDLADKINIVARNAEHDGSRIVHSMTQSEGSEILAPPSDETSSPWLARARSNLQIMYRTALAVSHTLDIDQLLARIMDMIFEWVDADRGCIMLKDTDTRQLVPKVRRHRRGLQSEERITISQTILDYVVDRNEGVLTSNARDDERWDPAQSILRLGVREAICVPMQGRYDVVGAIYIDTSLTPQRILQQGSPNKFTQEHLKLMIAIAHQAALAVEDTSYYKAMVQAEQLAAVGQTIASLSHHIKNILQGVRGGSYLIEMGMKDHDQALAGDEIDVEAATKAVGIMRKGWGIVDKNQERISALVMDMLTFSKEREPVAEPSNLNELTAEVVELVKTRAAEDQVEIVWLPAPIMPTLMFDPESMHRAILNIITNAIDACHEIDRGRVEVSTQYSHEERMARVQVVDNGSGIEKEDLDKIFAVFVSRKGGRGTGLGLPVSQKILQEHGGRIRVESQPGKGSRFTLEFPATAPHTSTGESVPRLRGGTTIEPSLADSSHISGAL